MTQKRFCNNCGGDASIRLLYKIGMHKGHYIYEAECIQGHSFSPTLAGLSVVLVKPGGERDYL